MLGLTSSAFLICNGSTLLGKVRIQVAQLKRSSFEGRFFVVSTGNVVGGALCALVAFDSLASHHMLSIVVPPDSHLRAVEPI